MAFSNQFYFVAAALTWGSLLSVYGAMTCVYNGYQLYRDNLMVPLCLLMIVICWSVEVVSIKLARTIGLWFREGEEGRLEQIEIRKQKQSTASTNENEDGDGEDGGGGGGGLNEKEEEEEEDTAADKNIGFRSLARIGLRSDTFDTFDLRLGNIHNAPAGLTASEMSFTINADVFSVVLKHWHTNWIGRNDDLIDEEDEEEEDEEEGDYNVYGKEDGKEEKDEDRSLDRPEMLPSVVTLQDGLMERKEDDWNSPINRAERKEEMRVGGRSSSAATKSSGSKLSKLAKMSTGKELETKLDLPEDDASRMDRRNTMSNELKQNQRVARASVTENEYVPNNLIDPGVPMFGWI